MVAARGACRAGGRRRVAALRAWPDGVRLAAADGRGSRAARRRPRPGARRPLVGVRGAGARAPRALALRARRRRAAADRRRRPLPRGRRGPRARSSSSATSCSRLLRDGTPAEEIARRRPVGRALARAARDGVRVARHPVRDRVAAAPRGDAARARAALAAPLRLARGRPARAVRLSPLAVLGHRPGGRRLRRGPSARPRRRRARPRRGGDRAVPRGTARSAAGASRRRIASRRRPGACSASMVAVGVRPRSAACRASSPGSTCARTPPRRGCSTSSRAGRRSASRSGPTTLVAALDRLEVTPGAASEPGRVAVLDLLRARTRRFDVGLRARPRGGVAPEAVAQLAVPRRRPAARARAAARASRRRQPRPLPLLHGLYARHAAAAARARGRERRRARRASRARSGTRCGPSSSRRT